MQIVVSAAPTYLQLPLHLFSRIRCIPDCRYVTRWACTRTDGMYPQMRRRSSSFVVRRSSFVVRRSFVVVVVRRSSFVVRRSSFGVRRSSFRLLRLKRRKRSENVVAGGTAKSVASLLLLFAGGGCDVYKWDSLARSGRGKVVARGRTNDER